MAEVAGAAATTDSVAEASSEAGTPTAVQTPTSDAVDATQPLASPNGGGLEEIVVTATKRETNLQKTPIAINVATAQALTDRHAQSLIDLGDGTIPSLR
ncbi:MAG: TonB-dependent receptor, partial [Sphingomicrobium sp.]